MINILKSPIQDYTHIFHVADIHIRLNKRHGEYREVFEKLYQEAKKTPDTTVIAVLGDVFHSKVDLSPECVQLASDFLSALSNIRPTILVAGNHDATLSNKSRLDSLTPIVDAINHKNLFYLKTTGLYGFGNILWNNMCVFDDPEKYIRGNTIPAIYRNQYSHIIALFHGPLDKACLETGYAISNPAIMPPLFDHNDIALLGDIHKKQDMQAYDENEGKPCIHYVGSLVQQNHGEDLKNHGYSLWTLKDRSYTFHEVPNEYGYFTIEIHKGQLITPIDDMPKRVYLRIKCLETIPGEVKEVIAKIRENHQVLEVTTVRMDKKKEQTDVVPICKDIILNDLTNSEYQGKLIREYLKEKLGVKDSTKIDKIVAINRNTNMLIKRDEFARNLKWKPIKFEWDNMFKFGEGNVIDFTHMNGVYGIFGPNRAGKSSILSALCFCLFDKFDRGFKGLHVRNVEKTNFRCKFEFEIAGTRYFIERNGETTRTGNVKVGVRFWKIVNGIEEELHGNDRRDTNEVIRDYVGTFEDFMLTALSVQTAKNNVNFIDMGNSDRKDLLVQFIGLNVFDRLSDAAGERNKELNTLLKLHKDKNYSFDLNEALNALSQAEAYYEECNTNVESFKKQIADVNDQIVAESANLIKLDEGVPTNLATLEARKLSAETTVGQKRKIIEGYRATMVDRDKVISGLETEIKKIEESNLVESHKTYKTLRDKINSVTHKRDLKKVEVRGKLEKLEKLKKHEYDPNCKYCCNNIFVKDAEKTKGELQNDKTETDKIVAELESLNEQIKKVEWVEKAYEKYTKLLNDRSKAKDEHASASKQVIINTNEMERLENGLKTVSQQIDLYHRNAASVQNNEKVNSNISAFKTTLTKLDVELQKANRLLMDVSGKITLFKSKIDSLTSTIKEVQQLEDEFDSYQLYLKAVGRDGIPYQVICNTVPEIEKEVNSILSQVVDYSLEFETDGKNVVPYVVYDQRKWPIEMCSGFERFVATLAIRVTLTNISNLPKTTFLAIDEGFGVLDAEHRSDMYTLFSFLKNNYDFLLIVTHLDDLKDAVDKTIELKVDGNFSKVIFE